MNLFQPLGRSPVLGLTVRLHVSQQNVQIEGVRSAIPNISNLVQAARFWIEFAWH